MITEVPGQEARNQPPDPLPPDPDEEPEVHLLDRHRDLLDSSEVAAISFNAEGLATQLAMMFAMHQQGVMQLAAIRELLEAEHSVLCAQRAGRVLPVRVTNPNPTRKEANAS